MFGVFSVEQQRLLSSCLFGKLSCLDAEAQLSTYNYLFGVLAPTAHIITVNINWVIILSNLTKFVVSVFFFFFFGPQNCYNQDKNF